MNPKCWNDHAKCTTFTSPTIDLDKNSLHENIVRDANATGCLYCDSTNSNMILKVHAHPRSPIKDYSDIGVHVSTQTNGCIIGAKN